jgi:hypothetical protein
MGRGIDICPEPHQRERIEDGDCSKCSRRTGSSLKDIVAVGSKLLQCKMRFRRVVEKLSIESKKCLS